MIDRRRLKLPYQVLGCSAPADMKFVDRRKVVDGDGARRLAHLHDAVTDGIDQMAACVMVRHARMIHADPRRRLI